jgi:cell division protein FtsW
MIAQRYQLENQIKVFIVITITLLIIGLIFIYSSSSVFALEQQGSAYYFLKKQIVGLALGTIGALFCYCIPVKVLKQCTPLFFWGSWLLTLGTLIPGISRTIHGSSRWLSLGGFSFQPSDLLKITLILFVARFIEKKAHLPFTFKTYLLPCLILIGTTSIVLLRQPDFGLTVTLATTSMLMLFIAGLPLLYVGIALGTALPTLALLIFAFPYRLKRILVFLDPWKDPKGAGFQIIQSLIAIGSGGWFGIGIGQSKQKFFYLPMQHTDFIFSIIAEETGFVGASIIVILYISFLYLGCKIALQLPDLFERFTVIGLTLMITLQAFINIFVTTGLLPTKGIGLPFISYGNSALICSLCMIGIIANMAKK